MNQQQTTRVLRRVLLVDDDPLVVKVYAERMRFEGWRVAIARDGWEACQEASRQRFDIILLDIRMPLHDGLDVLREIRKGEQNAGTPVWILTSLADGEQIEDSLRLGADGVFHKSMTRPDDLVEELQRIFQGEAEPEPTSVAVAAAGSARAAPTREPTREMSMETREFLDFDPDPESMDEGDEDETWISDEAPPAKAPRPAPAPAATDVPDREYKVYVNPFVGEGAALARDLGLEGYQCPSCGGQICLRLAFTPMEEGNVVAGQFICSQCETAV